MNENIIEVSDFIKMGQDLQKNKSYLQLAEKLKSENKMRIILDRESSEEYLIRYYYLNFRPFARIVLHHFRRSDIDGLHDHPWPFQTYILSGGYWEENQEGRFWRPSGYTAYQDSNYFHRLQLDTDKAKEDTWTLFLMGPQQKDWGFLKDGNWIQWEKYLNDKKR